jgi:hypothetical protein
MGQAAAPLSLASTGLSMAGSITAGNTAAENAHTQGMNNFLSAFLSSKQAELAASIGDLKAVQTNTFLLDRANSQLANIDAVMANTNTADDSPSNWAVRNRAEQLMTENRTTTVGNIQMQADADRNAAQLYMMSGLRAMDVANSNAEADRMNGYLSAAGTLAKGMSGLKWS